MLRRVLTAGAVVVGALLVGTLAVRDGGGCDPVAATPARDTAALVDACLAGRREIADRRAARGAPATDSGPSDAGRAARACAPLFVEAGCRDAHLRFDDAPLAERSVRLYEACRRAYCDKLAEPRPRACAPGAAPEDEQLLAAWSELRAAIHRHDLGEAQAARLEPGPATR